MQRNATASAETVGGCQIKQSHQTQDIHHHLALFQLASFPAFQKLGHSLLPKIVMSLPCFFIELNSTVQKEGGGHTAL